MAALRSSASRNLRPQLSSRYQHFHRGHQTTSPTTKLVEETVPPPPNPSHIRKYRAFLAWSTIALGLGIGAGNFVMHFIAPPALPEPGSQGDGVLMSDLNKRIDEEFKVKVLRGKCLGVTKQLRGAEAGWVEIIPPQSPPSPSTTSPDKPPPLPRPVGNGGPLMHTLRGAKNLAVERVFYDRSTKKLVAVVYFGPDLAGWPGVTHGGLLATALVEKIALANRLVHPTEISSIGTSSAAAIPQRLPGTGDHAKLLLPSNPRDVPHEPAQVSIDYVKPTYANSFHVIRVQPSYENGTEGEQGESYVRLPVKGTEWTATLETLDAKICVKAAAKFAPRSQTERAQEHIVEGAKWSYNEFREWMWPSRQKQSQIG